MVGARSPKGPIVPGDISHELDAVDWLGGRQGHEGNDRCAQDSAGGGVELEHSAEGGREVGLGPQVDGCAIRSQGLEAGGHSAGAQVQWISSQTLLSVSMDAKK